jgi:hypothetical protein
MLLNLTRHARADPGDDRVIIRVPAQRRRQQLCFQFRQISETCIHAAPPAFALRATARQVNSVKFPRPKFIRAPFPKRKFGKQNLEKQKWGKQILEKQKWGKQKAEIGQEPRAASPCLPM